MHFQADNILSLREPSIADRLRTIPPLPFRRGEGWGEGSVLSCCDISSCISRRPKALADVGPVITPQAANSLDVRISLRDRCLQRPGHPDHVANAVARCLKLPVASGRNFIPPNVAIGRFDYL